MSTDPQADPIDGNVRTLQIIHIALAMGVSTFLVIAVAVMRQGVVFGKDPWSVASPMTLVAIVFGASVLVAHALVPGLVVASQRKAIAGASKSKQADFEGVVALYTTQMIIGSALLEGGAFFNTIVYFLEGTAWPLLLALLLLGILVSRIPSRDRMKTWIDAQLTQMREERHLG